MENLSKRSALIISLSFFLAAVLIITLAMPREIKVVFDTPEAGEQQQEDATQVDTPTEPAAPVTPTEPAAPAAPTEPANPATPTEPANPAAPTDKPAAPDTGKGLNSTDPAQVAAFYAKARKATAGHAPAGQQTMTLGGKPTGGGMLGAILKVASPIIDKVLANNSVKTDWIPGDSCMDPTGADIASCSAKTTADGKFTEVQITFKEQTDGPEGDGKNGGPVARGLSTLGSIQGVLDQLGAQILEGKENVKLHYKNPVLKCKVDNATGKIVSGEWSYSVHLNISEAKLKLGITAKVTDLNAIINWKVVIPG